MLVSKGTCSDTCVPEVCFLWAGPLTFETKQDKVILFSTNYLLTRLLVPFQFGPIWDHGPLQPPHTQNPHAEHGCVCRHRLARARLVPRERHDQRGETPTADGDLSLIGRE